MSYGKSVGRPTVINKVIVQKLEQALRDGFSVGMACHVSGISRSTYYDHLNHDQDFMDKMELAQEWPMQRAKQVIIQAIDKGDLKAAQWWLERKARAEFAANPPPIVAERQNLFGTGNMDKFNELMADTIVALQEPSTKPAIAEA